MEEGGRRTEKSSKKHILADRQPSRLCAAAVDPLSRVQLSVTPRSPPASLSFTSSQSLLKLTSFESVMASNRLTLCRPLLLPPPIFPSIRVFSNELTPKDWSFSFNISPSNEHLGLISFGMDWLDLPAVQGTLKSLLQHHSSKASILQHSAFFMVQLSHPYMTAGKTVALFIYTDLCQQSNVSAFSY